MWKLFFQRSDKSMTTVTCKKKKDIDLRLAKKYKEEYGKGAVTAMYQKYPKKHNEAVPLDEVIAKLEEEEQQI